MLCTAIGRRLKTRECVDGLSSTFPKVHVEELQYAPKQQNLY